MYRIEDKKDYLLVKLKDDFDYPSIRTILHCEMKLPEYKQRNDIWLICKHHSRIHIDDLESIVTDVLALYPDDAERNRTALVIEPGLTEAIAELFQDAGHPRLPFEIKIFHTLDEAEAWIR